MNAETSTDQSILNPTRAPIRGSGIFASPEEEYRFLGMATRRGVRRDFYVVHHLPVDVYGKDYYAAYRARNPGFRCYIGYTMLETDRLPEGWSESLNQMDEIWVPSRFNQETFSASGVDPEKIHCIPLGLNPEPFQKKVEPLFIPDRKGFAFLSVFQWSKRKGADLLIRAFVESFDAGEDVCLVIRSFDFQKRSIQHRIDGLLKDLGHDPGEVPFIQVVDDCIADKDMPALYGAVDAFVLPSRGEGWGLPYLEAMAAGLPVIGTRWSGNMEFMHDENSFLIDVERLVPVHEEAVREMPYYEGHQYAEPGLTHLKALMREVFENRAEAQKRARRAQEEALSLWTRGRTARTMAARFEAWHAKWERAAIRSAPKLVSVEVKDRSQRSVKADPFHPCEVFKASLAREPGILYPPEPDQKRDSHIGEDEQRSAKLPEQVQVIHGDPTFGESDRSPALRIARTAFPLDGLPEGWTDSLNRFDEVWVPSDFNLRTFADAGVAWEKLVKIPPAVDAYLFGPHVERRVLGPDTGCLFLSVFPWSFRKGWDVLLEAFCLEFGPEDKTTLFLQIDPPPHASPRIIEQTLQQYIQERLDMDPEDRPRIQVNTKPFDAMPLLYRAAHAFVLPSRGEGYCRHLLEAMATGLPVITTAWSNGLEILNEHCAWLLDFERTPIPAKALKENPDLEGQHWAEPRVEDLRRALREIFEDPSNASVRGMLGREEVAEKFSIERTARAVAERLAILGGDRKEACSVPSTEGKTRLIMEGAFFTMSSTALVNREAGSALMERARTSLAIHPLEQEPDPILKEEARFTQLAEKAGVPFDQPAQVHVWHQWPPSPAVPASGRWVVWQGWEYGSLPVKFRSLFRSGVDEVWTYSTYCASEFEADGIPKEKIQVIPLGVNPDQFHPNAPVPDRLNRLTDRKVRFLFVGGTIWRKGIDILLSAYCKAFTDRDDVALVVKEMGSHSFYEHYNLTETVERLSGFPQAPEIHVIRDELDEAGMAGLYNACTCLVHPYRGEGFGLPVLEAMACGLPVIVSAGGACDDFIASGHPLLLPARRREV
ncbi:MAG: glycosyltransferase, partial [Planctomycetota bacterium]